MLVPNVGPIRTPFRFQGGWWVFEPEPGHNFTEDFALPGVASTSAGRELFEVVEPFEHEQYRDDLIRYLGGTFSMSMYEWPDGESHDGTIGDWMLNDPVVPPDYAVWWQ